MHSFIAKREMPDMNGEEENTYIYSITTATIGSRAA
jgi:hypothetical protein